MIAIDDFGSGPSSLSYLRQFKVDVQQSWLFARPMPLAEFVTALSSQAVAEVTRP